MSFEQRYHPNHRKPPPVRVKCTVTEHGTSTGVYTFGLTIDFGDQTMGLSGSVEAVNYWDAEAKVNKRVIDELATLLANEIIGSIDRMRGGLR